MRTRGTPEGTYFAGLVVANYAYRLMNPSSSTTIQPTIAQTERLSNSYQNLIGYNIALARRTAINKQIDPNQIMRVATDSSFEVDNVQSYVALRVVERAIESDTRTEEKKDLLWDTFNEAVRGTTPRPEFNNDTLRRNIRFLKMTFEKSLSQNELERVKEEAKKYF